MTDTATTYPDLITEILRYDEPEKTYRFYYLEPHEVSFNHMNFRPFQNPAVRGIEKGAQNYIETEKHQVNAEKAELIRLTLLDEGYGQWAYIDLPFELRNFVTRNQAPIEFQRGLASNHPSVVGRVRVWVRGDLP